jgi:hypothetical protein
LGEGLREFRLLRKRVTERLKARRDELVREREVRVGELVRQAKERGLPWAAAGSVVDRWRTAWSQALQGKRGFPIAKSEGAAPPPHVFRYTHGGSALGRLFSPRSRVVRLVVPPAGEPPKGLSRSALGRWLKKRGRGRAILRIGKSSHDFGLVLHRLPDPKGLVKKVEVVRSGAGREEKHPPRWDWHLQITVAEPQPSKLDHPFPGTLASLAPGWRRVGERLRVGVVLSSLGELRELWLPEKVLRRDEQARRIQARMDRETEDAKAALLPLLATPGEGDEETRKLLDAWEKVRAGGLRRLARRPQAFAVPGSQEIVAAWERRRLRLQRIRRRLLGHLRRHRLWWWQNEMLGLLKSYSTIVHPELSLDVLQRRKALGLQPVSVDKATTANQQLAGLHEARRWLADMARKTGSAVLELPSANMSKRCSTCGRCEGCSESLAPAAACAHGCLEADGPGGRVPGAGFECRHCGWAGDRGWNVARNLLAVAGAAGPAARREDSSLGTDVEI